jgi:hypothetical protein
MVLHHSHTTQEAVVSYADRRPGKPRNDLTLSPSNYTLWQQDVIVWLQGRDIMLTRAQASDLFGRVDFRDGMEIVLGAAQVILAAAK